MNVLQQVAGQVAALDLGYKPNLSLKAPKVLYLLGADNETVTKNKPAGTTVIYQGNQFGLFSFISIVYNGIHINRFICELIRNTIYFI